MDLRLPLKPLARLVNCPMRYLEICQLYSRLPLLKCDSYFTRDHANAKGTHHSRL
jgi:hypothetical protein